LRSTVVGWGGPWSEPGDELDEGRASRRDGRRDADGMVAQSREDARKAADGDGRRTRRWPAFRRCEVGENKSEPAAILGAIVNRDGVVRAKFEGSKEKRCRHLKAMEVCASAERGRGELEPGRKGTSLLAPAAVCSAYRYESERHENGDQAVGHKLCSLGTHVDCVKLSEDSPREAALHYRVKPVRRVSG